MKEKTNISMKQWIRTGQSMGFIKESGHKEKNHEESCDKAHPDISHEDWKEKHSDCGCGSEHGKCTCDEEKTI